VRFELYNATPRDASIRGIYLNGDETHPLVSSIFMGGFQIAGDTPETLEYILPAGDSGVAIMYMYPLQGPFSLNVLIETSAGVFEVLLMGEITSNIVQCLSLVDTPVVTRGRFEGLLSYRDHFFVSQGYDGFLAIRHVDPEPLEIVHRIDPEDEDDIFGSTVLYENYALVASGLELKIIDLTEPSAPRLDASIHPSLDLGRLRISPDFLYAEDRGLVEPGGGIAVFELRQDPSTMTWYDYWENDTGAPLTDFAVEGSLAYVLTTSHFHVLDISDPGAIKVIHSVPLQYESNMFQISGGYAYILEPDGATGSVIEIIDISDPSQAFAASGYQADGVTLQKLFIEGDTMYAVHDDSTTGDYESSLHLYDVANPLQPVYQRFHADVQFNLDMLFSDTRYLYSGSGRLIYVIER
jgi:hypothetical protein